MERQLFLRVLLNGHFTEFHGIPRKKYDACPILIGLQLVTDVS